MPSSANTGGTKGIPTVAGLVLADPAAWRPPARALNMAAAIWLRPPLWTQPNSTPIKYSVRRSGARIAG